MILRCFLWQHQFLHVFQALRFFYEWLVKTFIFVKVHAIDDRFLKLKPGFFYKNDALIYISEDRFLTYLEEKRGKNFWWVRASCHVDELEHTITLFKQKRTSTFAKKYELTMRGTYYTARWPSFGHLDGVLYTVDLKFLGVSSIILIEHFR